jgi:MraZ protein
MLETVQENAVIGPLRREFLNRHAHSLDPKRRLTIPSEWREPFKTTPTLYVLPDFFENCLRVIPDVDMEHRLEKIRQIPISDRRGRDFVRELGRQSDKVQWDAQGRIRIKDEMLDWAGLVNQVILIGAFDTFEIWDPQNLAKISRVAGVDQDKLREAAQCAGF